MQQRLDALRGEDRGLERDRLVVGNAHATKDDDAVDAEALALLAARLARVLLHRARARHAAAAAHLVAEGEDVGRRAVRRSIGDEGAPAGDAVDEPFLHEPLHRAARRHARDAELLAEAGVRRQRRVRRELRDPRAQRLLDLVVAGNEAGHASAAHRSG